jgi:hypothetical protein
VHEVVGRREQRDGGEQREADEAEQRFRHRAKSPCGRMNMTMMKKAKATT